MLDLRSRRLLLAPCFFLTSRSSCCFCSDRPIIAALLVIMEVDPPPPEAPPPPAQPAAPSVVGISVDGHRANFDRPTDIPGFDGFPLAIGYGGAYDPKNKKPIGSADGKCSAQQLQDYLTRNYPSFATKGRKWNLLRSGVVLCRK